MIDPSIWVKDPDTDEDVLVHYSELEDDVRERLFLQPIGGFIFPANMFALRPLPKVPFFVEDWLPKSGKALIYAPPKTGKSYLATQVARCIGAGEGFLGKKTSEGRVLYLQFELGESILQHRLRDETKKDYQNVWVGTSFSLKLDQTTGQKQLWEAMLAVEPDVLILDPFYKMVANDENETEDVLRIVNFLDEIIETCRCSVLLIHHSGKDESKRGRGSSVLEDWVDSYIQMKRISKAGEILKIRLNPIFLRHAALPPEPIEAEFGTDFEFHLADKEPTAKDKIAELAKGFKEFCLADMVECKVCSASTMYRILKDLEGENKLEKIERGRYKWIG